MAPPVAIRVPLFSSLSPKGPFDLGAPERFAGKPAQGPPRSGDRLHTIFLVTPKSRKGQIQ